MQTHEQAPPCAADALFSIRRITVRGRVVGVAQLCDAISDVRARQLASDEEIKAALPHCVSGHNYIPDALRADYAGALLSEYHNDECRCGG
ncbi:MAG: hypothetical protein NT112_06015 [Methanoregula sp.]|nr:hypothetical protein [Methanoregula sp.]